MQKFTEDGFPLHVLEGIIEDTTISVVDAGSHYKELLSVT